MECTSWTEKGSVLEIKEIDYPFIKRISLPFFHKGKVLYSK